MRMHSIHADPTLARVPRHHHGFWLMVLVGLLVLLMCTGPTTGTAINGSNLAGAYS